jgi:hypothetical protein
MVSEVREYVGRHEYDGIVADLSPEGVKSRLARVGSGPPEPDPHDEAHLAAFEARVKVEFDEAELHRRSPMPLLSELDVSCYDRAYAPAPERAEARRRHLDVWPAAVDAGLASLDQVSAPVAQSLLAAVEGLADGLGEGANGDTAVVDAARAAHARFVASIRNSAATGDPDPALGGPLLARLLGAGEGVEVDLGRLEELADAERDRLRAWLADACARLAPGRGPDEVIAGLLRDHPPADRVLAEAAELTAESIAFTRATGLAGFALDGECDVEEAPPSRRWATAMMSWAAPFEADAPSRFYVTPPDPGWPQAEQEAWLEVFNRASLPAIAVHEVAPGHFAHGRALRRVRGDVRRTLHSLAFVEGWAHDAEETAFEHGFRAGDARFEAGVALEGLCRVTRLAVALGLHRRTMTMDEAVARFERDAALRGVAAVAEARRATYDPTYGRYTWGKLAIRRLRAEAMERWGTGFTPARFSAALLALGSPPLGLMADALGDRDRDRDRDRGIRKEGQT